MHDMHTSRQLTRRALLRVAGLAGVGLLAACQGTSSSQSPAATNAPATAATQASGSTNASGSITWSFWGDPNELPPNDEVIQAFNQKYPNIEIKKFHEPFASYFDKIQTMFAGDSAPDVLFLNNIPSYASKNVLEPVDSLAQQSGYDVQDFVEAELQLFRFQGKLYGFPRDNDTKVLYFNKDAFDEVGLGYPDDKWNWMSLRDAANKLTKRQGDRVLRYGAAIEATEWPVFVWQNGAEVYDDALKPTKCLLDQPDQAAAVTYLADFMNTDKVSPNATALTQAGGVTNLFGSGLAAMAISNTALAQFCKCHLQVGRRRAAAAKEIGGLRWRRRLCDVLELETEGSGVDLHAVFERSGRAEDLQQRWRCCTGAHLGAEVRHVLERRTARRQHAGIRDRHQSGSPECTGDDWTVAVRA
jgi:ABC-type glycerol-3-phosphate transport system substrate-binding protein